MLFKTLISKSNQDQYMRIIDLPHIPVLELIDTNVPVLYPTDITMEETCKFFKSNPPFVERLRKECEFIDVEVTRY